MISLSKELLKWVKSNILAMKKLAFLALILVSLMLAGCTGPTNTQNQTNKTVAPPPPPVAKTPTFTVTAPLNDEVITIQGDTTNVTLSMSTQNLVLESPGGIATKGQGYFKVTLDSNPPQVVTSKLYTLEDLAIGSHTVTIQLYNNDKTPYSPAITKTVEFSVAAQAPTEYVPQSYSVSIVDHTYDPDNLTVNVGDSVTWTNDGNVPASATCSQNGKIIFDTKSIGPGQNMTVTFTDPLQCEYYSSLFRAMTGQMTVNPDPGQ